MAKYRVLLRIEFEQGRRQPQTNVTWSCGRLPRTHIHGGIVQVRQGERRRPEELGELAGVFHAIEHAESNGETLARDDIEVEYESLTHVFKRGKIERSLTGPSHIRAVSQAIYDEVNSRKRPLGSDVLSAEQLAWLRARSSSAT